MFQPTCSKFVNNLAPSSAVDVHFCNHLSWKTTVPGQGAGKEGGLTAADYSWATGCAWLRVTAADSGWFRLAPADSADSGWPGWLQMTTSADCGSLRLTPGDSGCLQLTTWLLTAASACGRNWNVQGKYLKKTNKSLEVKSQHQIQAKRLRGKKQVEGAII